MSYRKVTKPQAKKMFYQGVELYLLPCKVNEIALLSNSEYWVKPCVIQLKEDEEKEEQFEKWVNEFEYYNCNSQLGYYAHYYVKTDK